MKRNELLEGIYHKGQEKIWDGRDILQMLLAKHSGIQYTNRFVKQSVCRIFRMILKGEDAAWKISLQLGSMLKDVPARMAATSQAHDEARHFYVMRDYLTLCDCGNIQPPKSVDTFLNTVMNTDDLIKKMLGMQLMVEPVALTIFQEIRKINVEPVLSDLLLYYERDEARHVALGVNHLPTLMKDMNSVKLISLLAWQFRLFMLELQGLSDMRYDFENIGLVPEDLFRFAEKRQLDALEKIASELGWSQKIWKPLQGILQYQKKRILK
tara:strand:+ start:32 stop:835 length:804 start_codon:yes stop_codon:yes gene_type:complete